MYNNYPMSPFLMPGQQYYQQQNNFMGFDFPSTMNNNNNNNSLMGNNNMNNNSANKSIIKKEEEDNSMQEENNIEGDDSDSKDDGKKKYSVISIEVRQKFIDRVLSKEVTIKEAAKEFGIKFSTSKAILQTYKKEGRIGKKKTRIRKPRAFRAGDGDSYKTIPAALQQQNELVKKEHTYLKHGPQMEQESGNKMNDIQNLITQPQSGSINNQQNNNNNNSPYFLNNTNHNMGNNNNINQNQNTSILNNNNSNSNNQGSGSIMNKLKAFNSNANGRNLSINTGNGIVQMAVQNLNQNKSLNSLNQGLSDKAVESQFFNPFQSEEQDGKYIKQLDSNKNNRENVIDIKNLKTQLTQLSVDQLKQGTLEKNNLGQQTTTNDDEENSGQFVMNQQFNYNNYFDNY